MVQALVKTMEYSIQWVLHYGNVLKVVEMMITQKKPETQSCLRHFLSETQ